MPASTKRLSKTEQEIEAHFDTINSLLKEYGILLESDKQFPSVVGGIVGAPVNGSWWGHPKGMLIYNFLKKFSQQPDVLMAKLLSGKTTFIHRPLWASLLTVATSNEPWQTIGLSNEERRLYDAVMVKGELRTDEHSRALGVAVGALGKGARELEKRLLVYGEGFHSNIGSHAKRLETWNRWATGRRYTWNSLDLTAAKNDLERSRNSLAGRAGASPRLPWESNMRRIRREG